MLTRDSVTVAVDAVVYYRIKEPLNAVVRVADYRSVMRVDSCKSIYIKGLVLTDWGKMHAEP